jgi:DNA-directed RNA polymerase specialized sigma24 family protein
VRGDRETVHDLDGHVPDIRAGDPDAFGRWMAGAERSVRLSLRSFAAHVDTEAVLQEALLRVWQVAPRFVPDGRPNGLLRLAVRIARNLALSERRRLHATPIDPALLERVGAEDTEPALTDPLLRQVIAACREQLPHQPARALEARLGAGGLEPDETLAARLSMRLNTFLQNFSRARNLLAECLRKRGVDLDRELA